MGVKPSFKGTYHSDTNPRLCEVHQQTILGPAPCSLDLLQGQVCPVLEQMDLCDKSNRLDCPLD